MVDQLTSTGLTIDDLETRRASVVADLRANISAILDVSPEQPIGQVVDIVLERIQASMELLQEVYSAMDPAQATGRSLDAVSSITGSYRNPATSGTVTCTLDLNAVTTVPAGSQVAVSGDPDNIWVLDADVTSVGAGNYDGSFTAQNTGPIQALAGTITVIVTPVAGWNTVTNALDAEEGEDEETDVDFRLRRIRELFLGGSASAQSLQSEVSNLDWVLEAIVYANDYWQAVAPLPPHSVEVVIDKATNLTAPEITELAELIYEEKASGIQAYGSDIGDGFGTTSTTHIDDQGNTHVISWTKADRIDIFVSIDISTAGDYDPDEYEGDTAMENAIAASIDDNQIGEDVIVYQLANTIMNQPGLKNISQLRVGTAPAPGAGLDIVINEREKAYVSDSVVNIVITS